MKTRFRSSLAKSSRSIALVCISAACFAVSTTSTAEGSADRPMSIACNTTFAFTPTGSVHIEGLCHYTHLGQTTVIADQIVIPQPDGSLNISNTSVYTAANGDRLFATAVGAGYFISPTSVVFSGVERYNGGIGRFAEATGSVSFSGEADFASATEGTGHFDGSGTISY